MESLDQCERSTARERREWGAVKTPCDLRTLLTSVSKHTRPFPDSSRLFRLFTLGVEETVPTLLWPVAPSHAAQGCSLGREEKGKALG